MMNHRVKLDAVNLNAPKMERNSQTLPESRRDGHSARRVLHTSSSASSFWYQTDVWRWQGRDHSIKGFGYWLIWK